MKYSEPGLLAGVLPALFKREVPVRTRHSSMFGYRIRPDGADWAWAAFDIAGVLRAAGRAPTKAMAAAYVIRAHARMADQDRARAA